MVIAASFRVRGIWRCRDWVAAGRSQAGWGNFQPVVVVRLLSVTGRMSAPREPKRLDPPRGGVHDDGMDSTPTWFTGQLLLALPGLGDRRFEQAVIAMVSPAEEGTVGDGEGAPLAGRQGGRA